MVEQSRSLIFTLLVCEMGHPCLPVLDGGCCGSNKLLYVLRPVWSLPGAFLVPQGIYKWEGHKGFLKGLRLPEREGL